MSEKHEHFHSDHCGCSHNHEHQHDEQHGEHLHSDHCGCSHEHGEHHHDKQCHSEHCHDEPHTTEKVEPKGANKHRYILENLGCANCAAKMEKKISELPGVQFASITFATRQLCIMADHPDELLPQIQKICSSIESEVTVSPLKKRPMKKENSDDTSAHENEKKELICILGGTFLFILGFLLKTPFPSLSVLAFILAYLLLGLEILWTAIKNIVKGNLFDENFLMSLATLGAFAIAQYEEAVGVMLFYRIGEWFEHKAVSRSRNQIIEALDLRPESVLLVQGEETTAIAAAEAKIGDLLLVRPGDRIPLDGTVIEGESRIDTSPVTGEPVPVSVSCGSPLMSGCVNTSGVLKMRVDKILEESFVSRILDSVENAAAGKPKIDRFITKFARVYTPVVVLIALGTAIIPSLITGNWKEWIYTALTFLVISCPCALVLSVPLAFFSGIGAGSKQKILFKGGASIEALKNVRAVVMDKTGTITKGNFVLQEICPIDANAISETDLLSLAASCEQASTHPIGTSILQSAFEKGIAFETPSSIEEISGHGIKATLSRGTVLCGNAQLLADFGVNTKAYTPSYGTEVLLALNNTFIGVLIISDTIKDDAVSAVSDLKRMKIETAMLTGDSKESALTIASQTGISTVYAHLLPEEKLSRLQEIRAAHGSVMFVGDGINDAPVLAGADVGAAMGSGADAAIEAADVVFMSSAVKSIPQAIRIARETGNIAMQNVVFALLIKIAVMILGLTGHASMWFAVFADSGVAMLCVLNSIRILYRKKK